MIGKATADLGPFLDQRDAEMGWVGLQQLKSQQDAAGAPAYDNRVPPLRTHRAAPRYDWSINVAGLRLVLRPNALIVRQVRYSLLRQIRQIKSDDVC
ncbi:hypothetical protein [Bradyrhizobium sp. 186]|uniref:hypothetical protein n=1 Tax=Bradyrhizobium sp. 186 TaxID=2782654 RepID=UPI0020017969|nr:hypothetical protein [Bradyrhizobium sp. 186]